MSFYGNVTYYLSNAFNRIIYRNENSKCSDPRVPQTKSGPGTPSYEYALSPQSRKDETILETGNKWLVFADPNATVGNNRIQIFHQVVRDGVEDINLQPFNRAIVENEDPPELGWGTMIGIPSIVFDNAGHVVSGSLATFKMPTPSAETALDSVKARVSQLEELISGEAREDGWNEEILDVDPSESYATRISDLETKTNNWAMGNGSYQLEPQGIGSTFHEFLADFGLRKRLGSSGNYTYERLREGEQTPAGTYLSQIQLATSMADTATTTASAIKGKVNTLILLANERWDAGIDPIT